MNDTPTIKQHKSTFIRINSSPQFKSTSTSTTPKIDTSFDNDQSEKFDTTQPNLFMLDTETSSNVPNSSAQQNPDSKQPYFSQSDQYTKIELATNENNLDTKEQVFIRSKTNFETESKTVKRSNSLPTLQRKPYSNTTTSPKKSSSINPTTSPRNNRTSTKSINKTPPIHSPRCTTNHINTSIEESSPTKTRIDSFICSIERNTSNALLNLPGEFKNFLGKSYGELVNFCYEKLISTASKKPRNIDVLQATYILAIVQILDLNKLTIERYTNAQCKALMLLALKTCNCKEGVTYKIATITPSPFNYKLHLDINGKSHEILLKIYKSDLSKANLKNINLENTRFPNSNFNESKLTSAKCHGINMDNSILVKSYLHGADFSNGNFHQTNFESANLTLADFTKANLTKANFSNATLRYTNFTEANLTGVNLDGADFTGANFAGAIFSYDQKINLFKLFERIAKFNDNEIYPETARVITKVMCPRLELTIQSIDDKYSDLKQNLLDQLSLITQFFLNKLSGNRV